MKKWSNTPLYMAGCAVLLLVSACASSYRPVVDTKDVDMTMYEQDLAECRALAAQVDTGNEAVQDSLIGAGLGAAMGAAVGAITGAPGTGAAVGAVSGGIGGGATGTVSSEQRKKTIINNCLSGRGYKVLG